MLEQSLALFFDRYLIFDLWTLILGLCRLTVVEPARLGLMLTKAEVPRPKIAFSNP